MSAFLKSNIDDLRNPKLSRRSLLAEFVGKMVLIAVVCNACPRKPEAVATAVINRGPVARTPTDSELRAITQRILDVDTNSLTSVVQYNIAFRRGQKFFRPVNDERLNHGTYARLRTLFQYYKPYLGEADTCEHECFNAQNAFLDAILNTEPMRVAHEWLTRRDLAPASLDEFKNNLRQYWFERYSRLGGRYGIKDTSGFEHTFVGEVNRETKEVTGLHNWVRMYFEENEGRLVIYSYRRNCQPAVEAISFSWVPNWNINERISYKKSYCSAFIGMSPESEIALSTVCLLVHRGEDCPILSPLYQLTMTTLATVVFTPNRLPTIKTSFPNCPPLRWTVIYE